MSHANGDLIFFGFVEQVAFATPVTPPTKWVECASIEVSDDRKIAHKETLGTVSRKNIIRTPHAPGLNVKFPLLWEGAEILLKHALGAVNTTGPSGGYYTHAFALAAGLPAAGLTCYVDVDEAAISGDHVQQLVGAMIDKLTLTQEMGGTLDAEIEFVGREWIDVARTSPVIPTYNAVDYAQMTLATVNPASANAELPLRKWKAEINNNLFKDGYKLTSGGKRTGFVRGGKRMFSLEAEIEYESDTFLSYFKNATPTDLRFKWVNSIMELTGTTTKGYFQGTRPGAAGSGPVYIAMPYDAVMSAADNDEFALSLKNTVVSV